MSGERKFKASHFENIQELIASCIIWIKTDDYDAYCRFFDMGAMEELIKELNNLKEIEKSHKEENGKLRVELEQYKLLEANIDKANKIIAENKFDEGLYGLLMREKEKNKELLKEYNKKLQIDWEDAISKDKIKQKLELLKDILKAKEKDGNIYKQIPIEYLKGAIEQLEELLEEK